MERERARRQFAFPRRLDMEGKQRPPAAIEDIERGARTRIDLEQERHVVAEEKVGGGKPLDRISAREFLDGRGHVSRERKREVCRTHRSAIAPRARGKGRSPLLAEAEHASLAAACDEERRHRAPRDLLLKIGIGFGPGMAARHDMAAAGAAAPLGEPSLGEPLSATRGRRALRRWMSDAEAVERREEIFRRFEARDRAGAGPKQRPAS